MNSANHYDDNQSDATDYSQHSSYPYPTLPAGKSKKLKYIILGILVVILLGVGAWKVLVSGKSSGKQANPDTSSENSNKAAAPAPQDVPDVSATKTYDNGYLGIGLTYPENWTVIESENKDSVRLESPAFSFTGADQSVVEGNFRIYIRKGARTVDGKYIGRGVAVGPSEKLTYTKPALGQRGETSLSLFGMDTPDNFTFFLIAGNFQLSMGDTLGPDYGKEAETYIIAGGYTSPDLKEDLAMHSVPTTMTQSSNAYKQAINILKTLRLN